ncbi:hypothetical protein VN0032_12210 [Helicobacter pylori]
MEHKIPCGKIAMPEIRKKKIVAQIGLLKNSINRVGLGLILIFRILLWNIRLFLKKLEFILKC